MNSSQSVETKPETQSHELACMASNGKRFAAALVSMSCLALLSACGGQVDGDWGGEEIETDQVSQEVINGSTSWTGLEDIRDRTVRVMSPVGTCTGSLVDSWTVVTARHCVSQEANEGQPNTIYSASQFSIARVGGAWQNGIVDEVLPMEGGSFPEHDIALLFLNTEQLDSNGVPVMTGLNVYSPTIYQNYLFRLTGQGGDGIPRHGRLTLESGVHADYQYFVTINGTGLTRYLAYEDGLKFLPSGGQASQGGDSGGGYWRETEVPAALFAVHSGGAVDNSGNPLYSWGVSVLRTRDWILERIDEHHGYASNSRFATGFGGSSILNGTEMVNTSAWRVSSGKLRLNNNTGDALVYWPDRYARDFSANVDIASDDNDGAGIAFHIVDEDNYYYCSAHEQFGKVVLGRVYKGTRTELASASWNSDWNSYHQMDVWMTGSDMRCRIQGTEVTATDRTLQIGHMGLYSDHNNGVRFDNFWVRGN